MDVFEIDRADLSNGKIYLNVPGYDNEVALDLYYFSIEGEKTGRTSLEVLRDFFNNVIKQVEQVDSRREIYIPIDICDEFIGAFEVSCLSNEEYEIQYGFTTEIPGHSLNLQDGILSVNNKESFKTLSAKVSINKEAFVLSLEGILDGIRSMI